MTNLELEMENAKMWLDRVNDPGPMIAFWKRYGTSRLMTHPTIENVPEGWDVDLPKNTK